MTRIVSLLQGQITIDLVVELVIRSESATMTKPIVDLLTELVIEQNKPYYMRVVDTNETSPTTCM
jgi:hypothetical protein